MPERNKGRRNWSRGDIEVTRSLDLRDQWQQPAEALSQLREWAERNANVTIAWYLRDKRVKRWSSRLLRAAAVVLAALGGLTPLVRPNSNVGYVLLALAAGCVAFDHFFGLSAGWMRDMTTAQALQHRLTRFQLAWATWQATEAGLVKPEPSTGAASEGVSRAIDLVDDFVTEVLTLVEVETAQWVSDFHSSMAALRRQATPNHDAGQTNPTRPPHE